MIKKQYFVDLYGGKCSICGYKKHLGALEFHHTNGNKMDINPSHLIYLAIDTNIIIKELDKCKLVCANCHREIQYSP